MIKLGLTTLLLSAFLSLQAQNNKQVPGTLIGEAVKNESIIAVDDLMAKMEKQEGLETKVKGKISSVCQKKGCWMKMETAAGEPLHITFKDYALFMPKDLSGKEVVMEGKAWINVTPVEELQHYAEDAGKSKEEIAKIIAPKKEVRFEAKGVVILD